MLKEADAEKSDPKTGLTEAAFVACLKRVIDELFCPTPNLKLGISVANLRASKMEAPYKLVASFDDVNGKPVIVASPTGLEIEGVNIRKLTVTILPIFTYIPTEPVVVADPLVEKA
jgi:hypothetical protein